MSGGPIDAPAHFGKVAVLLGGKSAEREISLMSGGGVLKALRSKGIDAHPFDPAERDLFELKREGFARCFIALHGRGGEDGTLQGALEMLGVPYTGSGVLGSALAMDKARAKLVWRASGLPTPAYELLDGSGDIQGVAGRLGLPLVVKPANEGSSIGITKVRVAGDMEEAYALAVNYDSAVIAEKCIEGPEYTASIVGDAALPLIRIEAPQGNYDYRNKYFTDDTKYICPCGLPAPKEEALKALALDSFGSLGCAGWGRVDLMLDAQGDPWLLEANTSPGMTGHSLVPMAARAVGISYEDLCVQILGGAHVG
ncbi:MAG TPA: D-alanine--D-alanine ligase [Burkholderiales bacterium]|nr:D-alanine--D-alanine ligase [Burkholderiales bacterium]